MVAVVAAYPLWVGYGLPDLLVEWDSRAWREVIDPNSPMYQPLWVPYRWVSAGLQVVLLLCSVVLVYGLRHKRRWFPSFMVAFLAADFVGATAYVLLVWLTPVIGDSMHASDFRDLILVAAIAVFVIPYQMLSERVRATFTE